MGFIKLTQITVSAVTEDGDAVCQIVRFSADAPEHVAGALRVRELEGFRFKHPNASEFEIQSEDVWVEVDDE